MGKLKENQKKDPKKEEKTSEDKPVVEDEENQQRGVLPEDVDLRRGMGCG